MQLALLSAIISCLTWDSHFLFHLEG